MKLVQKGFLIGIREFEIIEDTVRVRMRALLKEEKLSVALSTLNPEPVANGSELVFHSRVNHEPLLSLLLNKPNARIFNDFVEALRQRIIGVDNTSRELLQPEALGWNVYEEPPEFEEAGETQDKYNFQPVNAERIEGDIRMLKTYLGEDAVKPLIDALETLKAEPENEAAFQKVKDAYNAPDVCQGAILTYAPYLKVLLSQSIWS